MSKKFSKYIASFDCLDKSLIVLSPTNGSISIASVGTITGADVQASPSFSLVFSIFTEILKNLSKTTRIKEKKHNKTIMLSRSKLNSIERKISEALKNNEVGHKDFLTIIN